MFQCLCHLTWRHSHSCVSDDLPVDGYNRDDVERLCARLICLRKMREEVHVCSSLSFVWSNQKCDPVFWRKDDNSGSVEMSIYDFMTLPSWGDVKVVEEPQHHYAPLIERVPQDTTAHTAKGALILLPTLDEAAASQPDPCLARRSQDPSKGKARISSAVDSEPIQSSKKRKLRKRVPEVGSSNPEVEQTKGLGDAHISKFCVKLEDSLERSGSIPVRAVSAPLLHLGSATSGFTRKPGSEDVRRCSDPLDTLARSALSRHAEYDQILEDNFAIASSALLFSHGT
ncbi:hypothetical protein Tco_0994424, partial [Tanacetum coccineum]